MDPAPDPEPAPQRGRRWHWQRRRLGRLVAGAAMAAVLLVGALIGGNRMRGDQPASTTTPAAPPQTISLTFAARTPSGDRPNGAQLADTARILSRRLDAAGIHGGSVQERAGRLLVAVPAARGRDDLDHITVLLATPGRLELRPVLQAASTADPRPPFSTVRCTATPLAPAPDKPVVLCVRPPGVASAANATVKLLVGPARLGNREIAAAQAVPSGLPADPTWQVVLRLTGQGGRLFQQLSAAAACQPADSIRRHIAIVLDGAIIEYPPVAEGIPCREGLSGDAIAISRLPEQEARTLAALMTAGSLPVRLERQP
jgi:preprotein translocase subunit SecD